MRSQVSARAAVLTALAMSLVVGACSDGPSVPPSGATTEGEPNQGEPAGLRSGRAAPPGAATDTASTGGLKMIAAFWTTEDPGFVHTAAWVENVSPVPVEVEFGSDALALTLSNSGGDVVWTSVARADPVTGEPVVFEDYLARVLIQPGESTDGGAVPSAFRLEYPTGAIYDTVGDGVYAVRAVMDLAGVRGELDLGTIKLPVGG